MRGRVDLSSFDLKHNSEYRIGRSFFVRAAWFFLGLPSLRSPLLPSSAFRRRLLQLFGAEIGSGAVIRPGVRVKFPWKLKLGDNCWIGEDCWIDNLAPVTLGDNVCISQGAYLCTGSHDWSDPAFRLIVRAIEIHDGAWIAARVSVGPGSVVGHHAVVGFGSVVTGFVPPYAIHGGNPATFLRSREITNLNDSRRGTGRSYENSTIAETRP